MHPLMLLLVGFLLVQIDGFASSLSVGTSSVAAMERNYADILESCDHAKPCIEVRALRQYPQDETEDCFARMERTALLLYDRSIDDPILSSPLVELSDCDTNHASLRYNLGLLDWQRGNRPLAAHHFIQGAMLLPKAQQAKWWTAAGAVAYEMLEFDEAYRHYMAAYQADSTNVSPMLLSNLSALFLSWNRPDLTVAWGERALERFGQIPNDHNFGISKNFLELVHFNLFTAHVIQGNRDGAERSWQHFQLSELPAHPLQLAELLSMFCRLIDEPMLLALHGEKIRNDVLAFETANPEFELTYNADPLVWLFTEDGSPIVNAIGLAAAWSELTQAVPLAEPVGTLDTAAISSDAPRDQRPGWMWAWWVWLGVLPIPVWQFIQNRRNRIPSLEERLNAIHDDLASNLLTDVTKSNLKFALAHLQSSSMSKDESQQSSKRERLNESEQIVLRDALNNVFPKETAQQNDWTPTYVYILRSSLRKKLGISGSVTFQQWRDLNEADYKTLTKDAKRSNASAS